MRAIRAGVFVTLAAITTIGCGGGGGGDSGEGPAPLTQAEMHSTVTDADGKASVTLSNGVVQSFSVVDAVTGQPVAGDQILVVAGPSGLYAIDPASGYHLQQFVGITYGQQPIKFDVYSTGYRSAPRVGAHPAKVPKELIEKIVAESTPKFSDLPAKQLYGSLQGLGSGQVEFHHHPTKEFFEGTNKEYTIGARMLLFTVPVLLARPSAEDLQILDVEQRTEQGVLDLCGHLSNAYPAQTAFSVYLLSDPFPMLLIVADMPPNSVSGSASVQLTVVVKNPVSGEWDPLEGAHARLAPVYWENSISQWTNGQGQTTFQGLHPSKYFLRVEKSGYLTNDQTLDYFFDVWDTVNLVKVEMVSSSLGRLSLSKPPAKSIDLIIPEGQTTGSSQTLTVRNDGGAAIPWKLSTNSGLVWVDPVPSGVLNPGGRKDVTIKADGSSLAPGQAENVLLWLDDPVDPLDKPIYWLLRIVRKNSAPVVTGANPSSGDVSGGDWVYVTGANFRPGAKVYFGSDTGQDAQVLNSSTILCRTAPGPAGGGSVGITVLNADDTWDYLAGVFSYTVVVPDLDPPVTTADTPSGTYVGARKIVLRTDEPATIYWTQDGSTPDPSTLTGQRSMNSAVLQVTSDAVVKYRAMDHKGNLEQVRTNTYTIVPLAAPPQPTTLAASDGDWVGAVHLVWAPVPGAWSYRLHRSLDGKTFNLFDEVQGTSAVDAAVEPGKTYWYAVLSVDATGTESVRWTTDTGFAKWAAPSEPAPTSAVSSPALSSPGNGTSVSTGSLVFQWGSVDGANWYEIQVSGSSGVWDAGTIFFQTGTSATNATPSPLPVQSYAWRVRASPDGGSTWGTWSAIWTFNLYAGGGPALTGPANGATYSGYAVTYSWQPMAGAKGYQFALIYGSGSFDPSGPSGNVSFQTPGITATSLTTDSSSYYVYGPGTYQWAVRADLTNIWSAWSEVRTVVVGNAPPPAAPQQTTLVSPQDGAAFTSDNLITFQWNAATGATDYVLHLAANTGFSPLTHEAAGLTGLSYTLPVSLSAGTYYWRVAASNGQLGPWSQVRSLTVQNSSTPPAQPMLTSPSDGTVFSYNSIGTFQWTAVGGATSYQFQFATDPAFANLVWSISVSNNNSLSTAMTWPAGTYYWRVAAVGPGGTSPWSAYRGFVIQ